MNNKQVILFDGECNLCNGLVNFIIKRDSKSQFLFSALTSEYSKKFLTTLDVSDAKKTDTIYLIEGDKFYTHSTAALKIARQLDGLWSLFYAGIIVPVPIRDSIYKFIGKHRHQWFGRSDTCRVVTPELKDRFLG